MVLADRKIINITINLTFFFPINVNNNFFVLKFEFGQDP